MAHIGNGDVLSLRCDRRWWAVALSCDGGGRRANLGLGWTFQEFRRAGPVFVGDMSRDGSPYGPKNCDVVCEAEADNDVRNQVCRHYEIGKGAQDDGFYMQRGVTVARTAIGGDRFLGEGNHPNGAAHFPPETTFHDALVAFHP